MEDKVAIVTGAARGIGRATAIELARQGARGVVVTDLNDESGRETTELVEAAGGAAVYVRCDVASSEQVRALMDRAISAFGAIDILHNNAGIHETMLTDQTHIDTIPDDVWDRVVAVNLRGVFLCTKYAVPHLRRSSRGPAIVNASSVGAFVAYPGSPAYASTKAGVAGLTRFTALDLAPHIRCNCYHPASTDTPMIHTFAAAHPDREAVDRMRIGAHLVGRYGQPEEIAKLVCFLASDDASFITGSSYIIDGGALAWRGTRA